MVSWAALLDEPVRKPGYIDKAYSRFYSLGRFNSAHFWNTRATGQADAAI
jgi:hypothetical protein